MMKLKRSLTFSDPIDNRFHVRNKLNRGHQRIREDRFLTIRGGRFYWLGDVHDYMHHTSWSGF